ncbi:MAG TPA: hypothetical protein VFT00_10135 [Nocardioides sp.]|nr:hypothetical protein [Nocardioides sp.]
MNVRDPPDHQWRFTEVENPPLKVRRPTAEMGEIAGSRPQRARDGRRPAVDHADATVPELDVDGVQAAVHHPERAVRRGPQAFADAARGADGDHLHDASRGEYGLPM